MPNQPKNQSQIKNSGSSSKNIYIYVYYLYKKSGTHKFVLTSNINGSTINQPPRLSQARDVPPWRCPGSWLSRPRPAPPGQIRLQNRSSPRDLGWICEFHVGKYMEIWDCKWIIYIYVCWICMDMLG